jgi:hypothetical protein
MLQTVTIDIVNNSVFRIPFLTWIRKRYFIPLNIKTNIILEVQASSSPNILQLIIYKNILRPDKSGFRHKKFSDSTCYLRRIIFFVST